MIRPRRPALRQFLQHSDYAKLREGVLVSLRQVSGSAGDEGKIKSSGMKEDCNPTHTTSPFLYQHYFAPNDVC